ncbi:tetratricopeptide repeat protein [Thermotoga sp.]|uniref:tetratricopeptide repeat protein n=1 Tax=Thermotoga sp. TaxID=28240 RepID=UPI0025FDBE70|nr:tetratricopeptide repeat protein [Thermotoga sp.]MCD6551007.1 tetratricopeptide repeat protein [Thermotoga sp.]
MAEHIITLALSGDKVDITTSTPLVVALRDLLYEGDWELLKEDMEAKKNIMKEVQTCEKLEGIVHLDETVYEPLIFPEFQKWLEEEEISVKDFKNVSLKGLYDLALEYADRNLYDVSHDIIKFMLDIDSNYAPAYELKGTLLVEQGRVEEGIKYLDKAVEIDPWLVQAYASLGEAYYNLGDYEKAVHYWERELEYAPDDKLTYFVLAETYQEMNRKDLAIRTLERLLKRDQKNIPALYQLSELYRTLGEERKAKEMEERIMKAKPTYPTEIEPWAKVMLRHGKYEKVAEELEKIVESSPLNTLARLLLVVPYVKMGKVDKAREILEDLEQTNVWYYYGKKEIFDELLTEEEKAACGIS